MKNESLLLVDFAWLKLLGWESVTVAEFSETWPVRVSRVSEMLTPCNECGAKDGRITRECGEGADYDSMTASMCLECLKEAIADIERAVLQRKKGQ